MNHFLSVVDVTDLRALLKTAHAFKQVPLSQNKLGAGKRLGLLFMNPSMRTRLSTQVAAANLGLESIVFNVGQEGWSLEFDDEAIMNGTSVEHVKDAAPILGQYFDILGIRTFPGLKNKEDDYREFFIKQFQKHAGIPVISLESATLHPLQSLADLLTITETFFEKRKPKVVLTWAPHVKALPQCVANSFAQWINTWGEADFVVAQPEGYELDKSFTGNAQISFDQQQALHNADFVYVKNWSSFTDYGAMPAVDSQWMITPDKLSPHSKVMHCLPVRRNVELSAEVLDSPQSLVTQQAANRVWAAQAVLSEILRNIKSI
jgi:N-succinyl-L-ornithine transcarbamylase